MADMSDESAVAPARADEAVNTAEVVPATAVDPTDTQPVVAVVMGSDSDWSVMREAAQVLTEFGVDHEVEVVSAHRTPEKMIEYGQMAYGRGVRVIIAGAGGAAHLPGMLASVTTLPVIGVPVPLARLDGLDSLLSIVQMPGGIPVATVSIGGAKNAGLLAVRILAASDSHLTGKLGAYSQTLAAQVEQKNDALKAGLADSEHP
jgi:5-(carboxyamino)imidazole ribonucleotide mutase